MPEITLLIALSAGILSFFSPCLLPVLPGFLAYVTGLTLHDVERRGTKHLHILGHTALFVLGFSFVFVALGWSASAIGSLFFAYDAVIRRVGAVVVGAMGLSMLDVVHVPFLQRERRMSVKARRLGPLGAFLIGLTFALGWSPCVGPILASILLLAGSDPANGGLLMAVFSLGFGMPFLLAAFAFPSFRKFHRHLPKVRRAGGVLLLITAVLLWLDLLRGLATFLASATGYVGV